MTLLDQYAPIVGDNTINEIRLLARHLRGKSVVHVNSTPVGGGVAEILNRMVPLLNDLEIVSRWDVIKGGDEFYSVTKAIHNALHGRRETITTRDYEIFREATARNLAMMDLGSDIVFIHDPQPCGLIEAKKNLRNHWIWRCHIDISRPDLDVWQFLKAYVERYDAGVISASPFARSLSIPQTIIAPSIDPLSDKNRDLDAPLIRSIMDRLQIPLDKPLITQVSRFDRLKDPVGVIDAFQKAKTFIRARLLLVGGSADDDPEGAQVLADVMERAHQDPDIIVLSLPPTSHLEINAIQRASTIIVQKSLREGFGLTVSEALWKGKPVIAGAVGGIPLQITNRHSGILVHSIEGTAHAMKQLLSQPALAKKLGENGREHVRQNFLLTRHLADYLKLFLFLIHGRQEMIRLS